MANLKFWLSALDFVPNSNFLLNGDMETSSYWQQSGDQSSMWLDNSVSYAGSQSLGFSVSGGEAVDVSTVDQSRVYDSAPESYGAQYLFDGLYPNEQLAGQWTVTDPETPEWFQVYYAGGKRFVRMRLMGNCSSFNGNFQRWMSQLEVKASNVGSFAGEETTLVTLTDSFSWTRLEWKVFSFSNVATYNFYRTYCYPSSGAINNTWMMTAECQFFEW